MKPNYINITLPLERNFQENDYHEYVNHFQQEQDMAVSYDSTLHISTEEKPQLQIKRLDDFENNWDFFPVPHLVISIEEKWSWTMCNSDDMNIFRKKKRESLKKLIHPPSLTQLTASPSSAIVNWHRRRPRQKRTPYSPFCILLMNISHTSRLFDISKNLTYQ